MEFKMENFHVEVNEEGTLKNDVFVDFEYERLNEMSIRFFMRAFVGKSHKEYRFVLKTTHLIYFDEEIDILEEQLIHEIIHELIESIVEIIMFVDSLITIEDERLN